MFYSFRSSSVLYAKILIYDKNKNNLSVQKWGSDKLNYIWYTHKKKLQRCKIGRKKPKKQIYINDILKPKQPIQKKRWRYYKI